MQKSLTTSRMQSSGWADYDRPGSMTVFAAAVRAGLHSNTPRTK